MKCKANKVSTTVSASCLGQIWNQNRCFFFKIKNKTFFCHFFLTTGYFCIHRSGHQSKDDKQRPRTHTVTTLSSTVNIWGALWGTAVAQTLMVNSEESVKVPQPEDASVRLTKTSIMRRLLRLKHNMRAVCVCLWACILLRRLLLHGLKKRYSPFPPSPSPPSDRGVIYSSLCARSQWGAAAAY